MLGAAVGCIGMTNAEFCGLYFEEFESIYKAWRDMNDARERSEWERTRILATICIQPHAKGKITPRKLLPLPWDNDSLKDASDTPKLSKEEQKARFERLARRKG